MRFTSNQTVAEFLGDDDAHPTFETFAICSADEVVGMVTFGQEDWQESSQRAVAFGLYLDLGLSRARRTTAAGSVCGCGWVGGVWVLWWAILDSNQ